MNPSDYSPIIDLISGLCYGTKLHMGILLLGNYGNEKLRVPFDNTIHKGQVCDIFKGFPKGLDRCMKCRQVAISKAIHHQKPFGGFCINGVYEYTRPIVENGEVICIIYIGNIYLENEAKNNLSMRLNDHSVLPATVIDTMEKNFDYEKCDKLGRLLETYIRTLLDTFPQSDSSVALPPLIENMKHFIDSNPYDITLAQLARLFHYNEKYLGRLFKQKTGQTIKEYSNQSRIRQACRLLTEGDDTILSIALRLGFNNVTYFNRLFKKYYDLTPTEYRCKKKHP